jgi:hypothetical protein
MSHESNQQDKLLAWTRLITNEFNKGKSLSQVIEYMVKTG